MWPKMLRRKPKNQEPEAPAERREPAAQPPRDQAELRRAVNEQQEAALEGPAGTDIQERLQALRSRLNNSEKGGLGSDNSRKFDRVDLGIETVLGYLNTPLTGEPESDQKLYWDMVDAYASLMDACEAYLSRWTWTDKGKARQDIVREIRTQAETDVKGLRESGDRISTLSAADRGGSLKEALANARRRTLELRAGTEKDLTHVGGAVSYIGVLNKGDLRDENVSGYFKEEETFVARTNDVEKNLHMLDTVMRRLNVSEEHGRIAKEYLEGGGSAWKMVNLPLAATDKDFYSFALTLAQAANSQGEMERHAQEMGLDVQTDGASMRISDRNVATSRIANMLGIGDVVAQSETAELKDANGGQSRKGNLMQAARGREALGLIKEQMRDEFKQKGSNGKELLSGLSSKVTPEFMKSLVSLQVLDNLIGQIDRHTNNYMIDVREDGMLGKVQGIDNDFSFGKTDLKGDQGIPKPGEINTISNSGKIGDMGRSILNAEGKMNLPHMDKKLADRILELRENEVRLMLSDVLEDWAIQAFWERVKTAQEAIALDRKENPDSGRYLTEDSQWDEQVLNDFRENVRPIWGGTRLEATSYLSAFLADSEGDTVRGTRLNANFEFVADETEAQDNERADRVWKEIGSWDNKDEAVQFVFQFVMNEAARQGILLLKNHGELNGDPDVLRRPEMKNLRGALGDHNKKLDQELEKWKKQ